MDVSVHCAGLKFREQPSKLQGGAQIAIKFQCEHCLAIWARCFQFHKGMTYEWNEVIHTFDNRPDGYPGEPDLWRD